MTTSFAWCGQIKTNHANSSYLSPKISTDISSLKKVFEEHSKILPSVKEDIALQKSFFLQKERNIFKEKMRITVPLFLVGVFTIIFGFVFFYKYI
ncbi:MAG: hypothetical protein KJ915_03030 [Candidatus Omnitrophica bacterium]|nr:hypothetical protein [Candidatus Omnitrophota bacterium]